MAKHCTNCGHELREGEKFCAECGTPVGVEVGASPSRPVQMEYRDITVPLNLRRMTYRAAAPLADKLILSALQREAEQGWQPEGQTDFMRLVDNGRVSYKLHLHPLTSDAVVTFNSVTIRMKREGQGYTSPPRPGESRYESCEIKYRFVKYLPLPRVVFVAEAFGPQGKYTAAESDSFWTTFYAPDSRKFSGFPRFRAGRLLKDFTVHLSAEGWEALPETGIAWYSYKFRRPVKG